jgi:hypothetical protein
VKIVISIYATFGSCGEGHRELRRSDRRSPSRIDLDRVRNLTLKIHAFTSGPPIRPSAEERVAHLYLPPCRRRLGSSSLVLRPRPFPGAEQVRVLIPLMRPTRPYTWYRVPSSSSVAVPRFTYIYSLPFGWCVSVRLTGVAAQKSCKRRIHIASSASYSTTRTQVPGTGATFSSSTETLSGPDKLRSLYAHTSRRTRSTSSTFSGPTSSRGSQGSQSDPHSAFAGRTSEELANHLNKTFGGKLAFPPELAARLLTHASHPTSRFVGHNMRFSFTGE